MSCIKTSGIIATLNTAQLNSNYCNSHHNYNKNSEYDLSIGNKTISTLLRQQKQLLKIVMTLESSSVSQDMRGTPCPFSPTVNSKTKQNTAVIGWTSREALQSIFRNRPPPSAGHQVQLEVSLASAPTVTHCMLRNEHCG